MSVKHKFLFNFSVTRTGGGLKRLSEYAKWFDKRGGAWFIIHPSCNYLSQRFPNNYYFAVSQTRVQRVFNDCNYLPHIIEEIKTPELYYSYGIPIYSKIGEINWFHMSNILPLRSNRMGLSFYDRFIRMPLLRLKIIGNYGNADIISAESLSSLGMISNENSNKLFLSINGSDNELAFIKNIGVVEKDNIAVVVGTQEYKALLDSYIIFQSLKEKNPTLELHLIGDKSMIPRQIVDNESVVLAGILVQSDVINVLKRAKYYISTTRIENSFNAASEGIFFSEESYISNIGPHQELLENENFQRIRFPSLPSSVLHVKRINILGKNIKPWNNVIIDIIDKFKSSNGPLRVKD